MVETTHPGAQRQGEARSQGGKERQGNAPEEKAAQRGKERKHAQSCGAPVTSKEFFEFLSRGARLVVSSGPTHLRRSGLRFCLVVLVGGVTQAARACGGGVVCLPPVVSCGNCGVANGRYPNSFGGKQQ